MTTKTKRIIITASIGVVVVAILGTSIYFVSTNREKPDSNELNETSELQTDAAEQSVVESAEIAREEPEPVRINFTVAQEKAKIVASEAYPNHRLVAVSEGDSNERVIDLGLQKDDEVMSTGTEAAQWIFFYLKDFTNPPESYRGLGYTANASNSFYVQVSDEEAVLVDSEFDDVVQLITLRDLEDELSQNDFEAALDKTFTFFETGRSEFPYTREDLADVNLDASIRFSEGYNDRSDASAKVNIVVQLRFENEEGEMVQYEAWYIPQDDSFQNVKYA